MTTRESPIDWDEIEHWVRIAQTQQVSAPSIVRMFTRALKADPERYRQIRERARADAVARMTGG